MALMKKRVQLAALAAVVGAAAVTVAAQQAASPQQQPPATFKLRVDYVEVDVVVTDKQGNQVKDLKKEDFQVLEDGKSQAITTFAQVNIPIEPADRPLYTSVPF